MDNKKIKLDKSIKVEKGFEESLKEPFIVTVKGTIRGYRETEKLLILEVEQFNSHLYLEENRIPWKRNFKVNKNNEELLNNITMCDVDRSYEFKLTVSADTYEDKIYLHYWVRDLDAIK